MIFYYTLYRFGKRYINDGRLAWKSETKATITHQNLTMTSSRQNKNRSSRQTPTATSTKRNSIGPMPLATSVNTPSTASATPVQQASYVDQISDLPTWPNKNNVSLEEQLKQQQLLIDKLTN